MIRVRIIRTYLNYRSDRSKTAAPDTTRCRFEVTGATQRHHQLLNRKLLTDLKHARCRVKSGPARQITRCKARVRSEEHTSELQSLAYLVCRLLLEKKKK